MKYISCGQVHPDCDMMCYNPHLNPDWEELMESLKQLETRIKDLESNAYVMFPVPESDYCEHGPEDNDKCPRLVHWRRRDEE